jgi:hypothetical protein
MKIQQYKTIWMLQINRNMFRNANDYHNHMMGQLACIWNVMAHAQKPDFVFWRHGQVHLNRGGGTSVRSTTGSRGVRISGSNAGYTMFWGSVKSIGYPLHLPVSPSLPLPCITTCHHISTGLYHTTQGQITALCHAVWWTGTKLHREIQQVGGPCHLKFMLSGNELENCCLRSSSGERLQYCWGLSTFS